jgi:hypothetical protein
LLNRGNTGKSTCRQDRQNNRNKDRCNSSSTESKHVADKKLDSDSDVIEIKRGENKGKKYDSLDKDVEIEECDFDNSASAQKDGLDEKNPQSNYDELDSKHNTGDSESDEVCVEDYDTDDDDTPDLLADSDSDDEGQEEEGTDEIRKELPDFEPALHPADKTLVWGEKTYGEMKSMINDAYESITGFRKNVFRLSKSHAGKRFVREYTRLTKQFNRVESKVLDDSFVAAENRLR